MTLVQTITTHEQSMLIRAPQVESRTSLDVQNLRIPGSTPVPPTVLAELALPVINHRGPEFSALLKRDTAYLHYIFQMIVLVLTFPTSGTGGQEYTLFRLFSPVEHVVAITIGLCGNCFAHLSKLSDEVRDLFTALNCLQVRLQVLVFSVDKHHHGGRIQ